MATSTAHTHVVDLDATFDFINTLEFSGVASTDEIPTLEQALAWLVGHGALHEDAARSIGADPSGKRVQAVHDFRSALRELSDAIAHRRTPGLAALERVNATLRAREVIELEPAVDGLRIGHRHVGDPLEDALARIAQPLVDEVASGRPERLRICANEECRWVFYDASPTARRRWCSMASCGNRAKAARHRARVRARDAEVTRRRRSPAGT